MIRIITDTASDITLAQAQNMDISLLSLPVTFGDVPYQQLKDDDFSIFYNMLETSKALPVTSLTTPGDYLEIFDAAKTAGDSVVVIPISSKLSGSMQSAVLAKEMAAYDSIHIIDTNQAMLGQRILVEHAVALRRQGKAPQEIAEQITRLSGRIRIFGLLDTLKYLIKGGRISKISGFMGTSLNIKPIVCLQAGAVGMAGKARGRSAAMEEMLGLISRDADFDSDFPFMFGYTQNRKQLDEFIPLIHDRLGIEDGVIHPVGGVIGTHLGPNAIAAAWVVKE